MNRWYSDFFSDLHIIDKPRQNFDYCFVLDRESLCYSRKVVITLKGISNTVGMSGLPLMSLADVEDSRWSLSWPYGWAKLKFRYCPMKVSWRYTVVLKPILCMSYYYNRQRSVDLLLPLPLRTIWKVTTEKRIQ